MLSPSARAALERAWREAVAAEIARRRDGPAAAAGEHVFDTLAAMAARLQAAPRPDHAKIIAVLCAHVRDGAFDALETFRQDADLAPAEVVARLLAAGEDGAALQMLRRYSRHPLTH